MEGTIPVWDYRTVKEGKEAYGSMLYSPVGASQARIMDIELSCLILAMAELSIKLKLKKAAASKSAARQSPTNTDTPSSRANASKLFGAKMLSVLLQIDEGDKGKLEDLDLKSFLLNPNVNLDDNHSKSSSEENNFHLEEMKKF